MLMSHSCWTPFVKYSIIMSFLVCDVLRFTKWKKADDGTSNDVLCLPAICCVNVPLITASVNQSQRVQMIPCSALVPTVSFIGLHCSQIHLVVR